MLDAALAFTATRDQKTMN
uniref:Uncharacterized protein n=1 Tax=Arundo donax TaxID=35708 RepID=A0A0A9H8Y1_ARUDO